MVRIFFLGENWLGSNARSCSAVLSRLGNNVLDFDCQTFFPKAEKLPLRIALRVLRPALLREYNEAIIDTAEQFKPDLIIAFKGPFILPRTLRTLSQKHIALYNYYPDTSAFAHGKLIPACLPEYDCVFYSKSFWYADVSRRLKLKNAVFLPHGYDSDLHRPVELEGRDMSELSCDVSFIATHTAYKERMLRRLIDLRPDLDLRIWGNGWRERCRAKCLMKFIQGRPLLGESYPRAIQAARINLAIMSGRVHGASSGDQTTSRTYIIPACGGFMLHERTSEALQLYKENEEIASFDSPNELAEKIDFYLAHPEIRMAIARAGHARCVPAYSYDSRMRDLMHWHYCRLKITSEEDMTHLQPA